MSMKTIAIASITMLAASGLQAADPAKTSEVISVKRISSISTDKNLRQIRVNANANLYVVTFEKPCSALRHSGVSEDNQAAEYLGAGTELKVGTSACTIKSIERDLDLPSISTARDYRDPRQVLAGPTEL
ncbi:MAG: hypothetical protein ACREO2_01190, partial [Arenimonas sp.]